MLLSVRWRDDQAPLSSAKALNCRYDPYVMKKKRDFDFDGDILFLKIKYLLIAVHMKNMTVSVTLYIYMYACISFADERGLCRGSESPVQGL